MPRQMTVFCEGCGDWKEARLEDTRVLCESCDGLVHKPERNVIES